MRGADLLVAALAAAGVTRIFSLSGNQIMPVYDACIDAGIEIIHTRHEAAAVYMADAYAQLTGTVGVALVTAGPGVANTLGSLFTAQQSASSVVLLSGDSPQSLDGRGAFQALDQMAMTAPVCKHAFRACDATMLASNFAAAATVACSGRPGPSHLVLPYDLLVSEVEVKHGVFVADNKAVVPDVDVDPTLIDSLQSCLVDAQNPLALCGPALSRSHLALLRKQLAQAIAMPVVLMESPRGLKDPSLGDFAAALRQADLIVCFSKAVDFTLGYGQEAAPNCRWITITADPAEAKQARQNLHDSLQLQLQVDPIAIAEALIASDKSFPARHEWCRCVDQLIAVRAEVPEPANRQEINSYNLCRTVQCYIEQQTAETIVISDGGEFGQWSQAYTQAGCRLINGQSGAIGAGLCYAIGAKKAQPASTVFVLMGDGTAGFHLSEFETAVRENTPFVAIIGNDQRWNAEHLIQLRDYGPDRLLACELSHARYDQAAQALGAHGEYVTRLSDLGAAIQRALDSGLPACVNVMIEGLPAPQPTAS